MQTLTAEAIDEVTSVKTAAVSGYARAVLAGATSIVIGILWDISWHAAYGLDVRVLSPPHAVLALGMWAIVLGALMLVLREQNLAPPGQPAPGRHLFIYASGVLGVMAGIILIEYSFPNQQRTRTFYQVSATTFPLYLLGLARASKFRWGATWIALVYMVILTLMAWVLHLFPGHPSLGPIY